MTCWRTMEASRIGAVVCLLGVALIAHPTWLFPSTEIVLATDNTSTMRKIGDRADAVVMVFYYGVISLPMTAIGSKIFLGTWNVIGDFEHFSFIDYCLLVLVGIAGFGGQWFTNLGLQNETTATVSQYFLSHV